MRWCWFCDEPFKRGQRCRVCGILFCGYCTVMPGLCPDCAVDVLEGVRLTR